MTSPWGDDESANAHWRSRNVPLTNPDGGLMVNFIGKFESLDEDWRSVLGYIGLPYTELPRLRARREGSEPPTSLTPELAGRVARRYADDYRLGGYTV